MTEIPARADVVIIGSGHNGLVAAIMLARAGLATVVLEADSTIGGATRTERIFPKVPGLRQSTGSYLLGLMPPELLAKLDVQIPTRRRDPHYFLPTPGPVGSPYLLFGTDRAAARAQLSPADLAADDALQAELADLREDLAPAWLAEPGSVEETAERYLRPALRKTFIRLVRGSVAEYLAGFDLSELLTAMYAVTDGLSGAHAGPDDPGTGHNFLLHNMCRLPGADGTWMIAEGGMGRVAEILAGAARRQGAQIIASTPVAQVLTSGGAVSGVALADGRVIETTTVLGACDPFRLAELAPLPAALADHLASVRRSGTTMKVNLALSGLPRFRCLPPDAPSPFGSTIHLLPESLGSPMAALRRMWEQVRAGELPDEPTIEWYVHTTVDPSLQDDAGHHSSALFVQSVPYAPNGGWDAQVDGYVDRLLEICERYAPGTRSLVVDVAPLTPPGIERHFGITGGHIQHLDNTFALDRRMPYFTGVDGLYAGSAGCHPGGGVTGAPGHNAAVRILTDLNLPEF
ncbi:phytoene dehydrogenase-like protein [Allocatelliglobosispora scoriae]|uniref:Pyridine nucleotide-disulfide oxidoreductase domain-containing protein 2 n=1 Tax=Allocatelliglobosispora scoriae TaxID=643052 RepID=A0A841BXJ5_9ACTN|nr:NAD(P)/FAD-dependent oxidoreductase [Allocatelliglobosispora scoriae]MBB5872246.1 phytoene dehydrogenase-like protein [Allocatelliglobosispora scoriae]